MEFIPAAEKPPLPHPDVVAQQIKAWAAAEPRFIRYLNAKMPAVEALTRWALELLRANEISRAVPVLRSTLVITPDDPGLWANYGNALNQSGSAVEAVACLEYSVSLLPQQPHAWLMLGLARRKLGDFLAAEAACRVALEQKADWSVAWQLIGAVREQLKDYAGASDSLNECIRTGGSSAAVQANLGKLQYQLGRIIESAEAYTQAAAMDPANDLFRQMARKTSFQRRLVQGEPIEDAIASYQNAFGPAENYSEKDLMDLLHSSFSMLSGFGHLEAATRVGRKHVELWPGNPSLVYLLSAVTRDPTLDHSPADYVIAHFDGFAEGFEAQLVGVLGYDMPEKICAAVREIIPAGQLCDTLDGGCGTGLCGPLLRPLSRTLTGVDLSPKMLEQAGKKAVYDTLTCEDLAHFLLRSPAHFDLFVAADLLIYFGNLAPLFAAAAAAVRPRGLFAFSTELWTGGGFHLLPSGRFAHGPQYVRSMAARDFEEVSHTETTIRFEATQRLRGDIFIFRRRG